MRYVIAILLIIVVSGCGTPSFLITPISNTHRLEEEVVRSGKGLFARKKIALIEVEGMLANARTGGLFQAQENPVSLFVQQMERAEKDPDVVAVVLRVNSPGGTVSASDLMYQTVRRFREKSRKPVVASAQEISASGAYYVSCGADRVVVQPTSVVGSIGVIFSTFDISGTMAKIGARSEAIKSGPLKDMASPFKPLTDPERAVMQGMVDEYFARFREVVRTGRKLDEAKLTQVADGRVFTGQTAVSLGLADQVGLLDDAIDAAEQLSKTKGTEVVLYKRPYGYGGSIYARGSTPPPQANVIQLNLPPSRAMLPTGFYYLWDPQ